MDNIEANLTTVALPQNQWDHRDIIDAWIAPVADVLGQEFEKHAGTIVAQQEQLSIKNWQDHELRQKAVRDGALPIAIGLFADKAAWKGRGAGTRDSTVNYFVNILCQLNRRCLFTFRSDFLCGVGNGCACRGRCTLDEAENCMVYHMNWAAEGIVPEKDYGSKMWVNEAKRDQVGKPFLVHQGKPVRFILIEFRGDWDHYSSALGMPYTNQKHFCWAGPCRLPRMHKEMILNYTHDTFMAQISLCRIEVLVGYLDINQIWPRLRMDFRKQKGMHGRVLGEPVIVFDFKTNSPVELHKYDRLETGGCCRDVHALVGELRGGFPFRLFFWRRHPDVDMSYLSRLFQIVGFRHEFLCIGDMHTLDLGVTARLIGVSMVRVLKSGTLGNLSTEEGMKHGCRILGQR